MILKIRKKYKKCFNRKNIYRIVFMGSDLLISLEKSQFHFLAKNAKTRKAIVQEKSRFLPKNRNAIFHVFYVN